MQLQIDISSLKLVGNWAPFKTAHQFYIEWLSISAIIF